MSESVIPAHVGLILDGNRRWARDQGLPTLEGHRKGYENLKEITKHAVNQGVKFISAYIFSTENWNRSREEVNYLMDLALWVATKEVKAVHKEGIRVLFLGRREGLSDKLTRAIEKAEDLTKNNDRGTLALCFNYGGQQEIADAIQGIIEADISAQEVTPALVSEYLYKPDVPPVDFLIRTSGEQRISNFMLWRVSYAELLFVDKHWPAFTTEDLDTALADFAARQRRFGK